MNKLVSIVFFLFISISYAQVNPSSQIDVPWTISFGVNVVDNDGFKFDQPFDTDNWNFKNPLTISVQRKWREYWAAGLAINVNTLEEKNKHNNGTLNSDVTLLSLDAYASYIYDHLFMNTPRIDPFEAYVISGLGYTFAGGNDTGTFNIGLGFNFWIIRDFGIRLQTIGKFGFNEWQYLKNYIQHSAELIVRF